MFRVKMSGSRTDSAFPDRAHTGCRCTIRVEWVFDVDRPAGLMFLRFCGKAAPGYFMGQTDHQVDQQPGRAGESGSEGVEEPPRGISSRLPRLACGTDRSGGGPERADFDC